MIKNKKGFSLVELIVIIAVMAVLIAVLAPSLLSYTERSRAQKDESSMDEVVNAVQLAMANSDVYDEAIKYSCSNNFITYTDSSGKYGQQINDGEYWAPDGSGKATTITFNPESGSLGQTVYKLENGIVNDMTYGNGSVAQDRVMEGAQIENNQCYLKNLTYLYNLVRQSIGNDVITASSTYKNSSFTIFIKFSQKDSVKVADVSGAFNGTNLLPDSQASKGSGTSTYDPDTGEAQPTITTPGKQETQFTQSDLSGDGALSGSISATLEDYKQPTYVENLQKENDFEYYSSLMSAINDINNNTYGKHADCDKSEATAGIYIDNDRINVVLLKDYYTTERVAINKALTLVLGGNKIIHNHDGGIVTVDCCAKDIIIDARINGSEIENICDGRGRAVQIRAGGSAIILDGTYRTIASWQTGDFTTTPVSSCIFANGPLEIYDAEIVSTSNVASRGISSTENVIIRDCNIVVDGEETFVQGGSAKACGIYAAGENITIDDCSILVVSSSTVSHGIFLSNEQYASVNAVVENCVLDFKNKAGARGIVYCEGVILTENNNTNNAEIKTHIGHVIKG